MDQYLIPVDLPVCRLECRAAWDNLTEQERLYAHYMSLAAWEGSKIVLVQTSYESPLIFSLLQLVCAGDLTELEAAAAARGVSSEEFQQFMVFAAAFHGNCGNYKSFGDTKFVPALPVEKFRSIVESCVGFTSGQHQALINKIWEDVAEPLYSLSPRVRQLGLGSDGVSTYYTPNCTQEDAKFVQGFMDEQKLPGYNTRLFKYGSGESTRYEVRIASASKEAEGLQGTGKFTYKGVEITVIRGDYAPILAKVSAALSAAIPYAANETQKQMLQKYVESFNSGSITAHKDSQRFWIQDKGPVVETNIGFIETYRDPFGVRGEFEGFVAVVNKVMTAKFGTLVSAAERLLSLLPWPKEFEKDRFLQPDFTSLEVLTFAGSGIPAGINIPNYDEIRQTEGFKNVSLGNVLAARVNEKISFIRDEDQEMFQALMPESFEVQVGLHELLGHGSGKLLSRKENGEFNFDRNLIHPITNQPVHSWYEPGETWESKFTTIAPTYEECRAECVGIYLCTDRDVLEIFGHTGENAGDIFYINWLLMARAGLLALEFYTPETRQWRQAHMQARFAILQVMLEAGNGLVRIDESEDGKDLKIVLDRSKIESIGREAVGAFLQKLNVYKATGDSTSGREMYDRYTSVNEKFLALREVVLLHKRPRKVFVQANTVLENNGQVNLVEYEPTANDLVKSFTARFPVVDEDLMSVWASEKELQRMQ